MKIVHIHHHYWPVIGGLENVVKALAEGMAKLGHEVHVITSTHGAEGRPREEEINGVHIRRIRSVRFGYPDLTRPLYGRRAVFSLKRFLLWYVISK